MKNGLVLEGGAMRGMFTAGVLDVLMENGVTFDGAVGVSAGATFGCNIKSGQNGRCIRYNLRFAKDPRYCGIRSLIKTGDLYGVDFCYHQISEKLDPFDSEAFSANPMKFYVVATDVETGKPVYYECTTGVDRDLEWIRGSASMPLVSRAVEVDGRTLLDGGISDSIPLAFMQKEGYSKNVVVLTRPATYRKHTGKLQPLMRAALRDKPAIARAMDSRAAAYNTSIRYVRRCEAEGSAYVICPPEDLPISRVTHDEKKIQETYEIGRKCAAQSLDAVKQFLSLD